MLNVLTTNKSPDDWEEIVWHLQDVAVKFDQIEAEMRDKHAKNILG